MMKHQDFPISDLFTILTIILLIIVAYLIPTIIAVIRRHDNKAAIAVVNIALGWTFLGYVFALVWSLTNSNSKNQIVINQITPQPALPQVSQQFAAENMRHARVLPHHSPAPPVIDVLPPLPVRSLKAKLEELKELHDGGLISADEYQDKRKTLLS